MDAEDIYFRDYFAETDIVEGYSDCVVRGDNVYEYNYTKDDLVTIFQSFPKEVKTKIRHTMVAIDFKNGDMQDYIDFIMAGYTASLRGEDMPKVEQ